MKNIVKNDSNVELRFDKKRLGHTIAGLGYNNPNDDSDQRQGEIFKYIFDTLMSEHDFDAELKVKVSDLSNLAKNKNWLANIYKYLQPRASREGEDLDSLVMEFYVNLDRLLRIPVVLNYKNTIFPLSGNRRMKAHFRALHEMRDLDFALKTEDSRCDYLELTAPENMSEKQIIKLARKISVISNNYSVKQTRQKTLDDWELELRGEYELEWKELSLTVDDFREKATEYFNDHGWTPTKNVVGDLVNRILGSNRGQLVDKLTQDEVEAKYAEFFSTEEWVSDPSSHYFCSAAASSRFEKSFVPCMEASNYLDGDGLPSTRPTLNFVVTRTKTMTNVVSINKDESSVIDQLTKFNLNSVAAAAKFPLVERLMFPKHINHDLDYDTAYTWSKSKKKFIQV
ncbi:hypothetical protein OAA64_00905 [bacterium]|nr:hypothetical protein [bacterium]